MADTELIFKRPAITGLPVTLIFNEQDGGGSPSPDLTVTLSATITDFPVSIEVGAFVEVTVDAVITNFNVSVVVGYLSDTPRPVVGEARARWQKALPHDVEAAQRWQQARPRPAADRVRWQQAQPMDASLQAGWSDAVRDVRAAVQERFQQALPLATFPVRAAWQESVRTRAIAKARYQEALRLPTDLVRERFSSAIRMRRSVRSLYQDGQPLQHLVRALYQDALQIRTTRRTLYQQAMRPPPGKWVRPVVPPQPDPCYVPELPVVLVFTEPGLDGVLPPLVFICERHGGGPGPGDPQYVIPLLKVYMTVHTITAVTLPGNERVPLTDITIDTGDGGYGWTLSASGPISLMDQLAAVGGAPARVLVTVDGIEWVFAITEPPRRTRSFGSRAVAVVGRSVTALLGDPFMRPSSWSNSAPRTAQQLVAQALEFTGIGVDWGITDWTVPAGVWSFQGTPLAVAQRIAEAAGAILSSHRTDGQLRFSPKYTHMPWEWAAATPNVQMPSRIITTDTLEPAYNPAWEAVYVVGEALGFKGHVVRVGTAETVLAEQVTDSLMTHADAVRQRGRSVLGAGGKTLNHGMTVPLLTGGTNPGLILPGYLIEVVEPAETWRGVVRSLSLRAGMPTVRQSLMVERKAS